MCGIAGLFFHARQAGDDAQKITEILEILQHRGPDAQQIWQAPGVVLGHVRLSILDLDMRSNQPMVDPDTGRVIVFNGEIYNYLELKTQLLELGLRFRTASDTEVILKAYERWGIDCLNRFNGMWAFAIYDPVEQSLFCARDRFGIKPFIYGMDGEKLAFASESKALWALGPEWREPNWSFLKNFILHGDFAGYEETFCQKLYNLLPGHYFVIRHGEVPKPKRYWAWGPGKPNSQLSEHQALEAFQALLEDSLRLRFRSDVPVGVCLSGGMDSTSIVGLSTRLFNHSISTFSCIFPEWQHLDEAPFIHDVVQRFDCDAHFATPQFENFLDAIRLSVWEQDGPTGGPTVLSQRAVMTLAKGKVTVLLDGQGGDEVLGGYHTYFLPLQIALMRRLLRRFSFGALTEFFRTQQAIFERKGRGFTPRIDKIIKRALRPPTYRRERYGKTVLDELATDGLDDLSLRMLEDLLLTLCNLLHYEDRNSMACSLESRLPFLDYRLVEFLFSLPPHFKIREAKTKFLLQETLKELIPASILNRKDKMGFSTPGQQWYVQQPETIHVFDSLMIHVPEPLADLDAAFLESIRRYWLQCKSGQPIRTQDEKAIWRYVTACFWLEQQSANLSKQRESYLLTC